MPSDSKYAPPIIGSLNEKPLHATLKSWYAGPDAQFEVPVDGFVIDIVQGDLLVEIQTRSFAAMKRKLMALTSCHPVRLVYPVAQEKWIIKLAEDEQSHLSRRKSPKRGSVENLFDELVSFPKLITNPNFSIEVLLILEEELRRNVGRRAWRRRGWATHERRLLEVVGQFRFESPADFEALLPDGLPAPFTTADLASALAKPRRLAQKMAYCLREMGVITAVGKQGRSITYALSGEQAS